MTWWRRLWKPKQTTFVFCPTCRLEQIAHDCFVEDTDLVRYRCVRCGTATEWLFDAPVPLLIKSTPATEGSEVMGPLSMSQP